MKDQKKMFRYTVFVLAVSFALIVLNFGIHTYRTYKFNHKQRTSVSVNDEIFIDMHTRSGDGNSWVKQGVDTTEGKKDFTGTIFDATITNNSECNVSDWSMRFEAKEECYINSAWCGTLEIHQNVNEDEKVQLLDLRNYAVEKIELEYMQKEQDLMIHMYKGDYFIYHPGENVNEKPIGAFNGTPGSVTIGFIFYYETEEFDVSSVELNYYLEKSIWQGKEYRIFNFLSVIWIIAFVAFVVSNIVRKIYNKQLQQKERIINESLDVFSKFVDAKDPYTKGHSGRVADYAVLIAKHMGMSEKECKGVYYAGILHDIGKCYVPDEVLKKPGRLTAEEFEIIKKHTEYGSEMLKDFDALPGVEEGARYHHERYDGKGYPTGAKGEEIPIVGRILCVADSFDAMNSSRCYRKSLSKEYIIEEIEKNAGTQFDPHIAEIFLSILENGEIEDYE